LAYEYMRMIDSIHHEYAKRLERATRIRRVREIETQGHRRIADVVKMAKRRLPPEEASYVESYGDSRGVDLHVIANYHASYLYEKKREELATEMERKLEEWAKT